MFRQFRLGFLAILALSIVATGWWSRDVAAHAEIERSSPPADSVLAAPPRQIEIWTTEAVASGGGSPDIRVLDESGKAIPISKLEVDPSNARHVTANVEGVGYGTFTVVWSLRSEVDGHTLSGTYAFRVGGTSRAPGAATVEGDAPAPWAVVTRWITFFAAGIVAAGFLFGTVVMRGATEDAPIVARRFALVAAAALAGAVATLAEPLLQTIWPPAGARAPSFSDALNGQPSAWLLRAPALAVALVLAVLLMRRRVLANRLPALTWLGSGAGFVAMLGLALTSHASARESLREAALSSVIVHQWSVGLWAGGLIILLLSRPLVSGSDGEATPIARFSRFALWLAIAGIGTGVINSGLVLPRLSALWESDYGRVIIAKVAILVPVLALATFHRLRLRRALESARAGLSLTLRAETALIVLVVLGGSLLALLSPPVLSKGDVASVDLAAPLPDGDPGTDHYVRLVIDPASPGENSFKVAVTNGKPLSLAPEGGFIAGPAVPDVAVVRVTLSNLALQTAPSTTDLVATSDGWFAADDLILGLEGWWRVDVLVRRAGVVDATVPFFLVLPDPNVHGTSAGPVPSADANAKTVFDRGLTGLTSLHSVHFIERLSGGTGLVVVSDHVTLDGTTGAPAALRITTDSSEMIRSGGQQWIRDTGEDWRRTDSGPVIPPSAWGEDYAAATAFRLGGTEQVGDRTAQIVTFFVPGEVYASAWYAWWVDVETGRVLRETMVSRGHYMEREFDSFDAVPPVTLPE